MGVLTEAITPLSVITTNTADLLPQLLAIGGIGVVVGAGLLAFRRGWGFFKGMSR